MPFSDEPTRQLDDALLNALRTAPPAKASPKPTSTRTSAIRPAQPEPPIALAAIDALAIDDGVCIDEETRPAEDFGVRFRPPASPADPAFSAFEDHRDPDEATRHASLEGIAAMERARGGPSNEERTRAVNIRNDPSISDIDWDLD